MLGTRPRFLGHVRRGRRRRPGPGTRGGRGQGRRGPRPGRIPGRPRPPRRCLPAPGRGRLRERRPVRVQPRGHGSGARSPSALPRLWGPLPHDPAPARARRAVPRGGPDRDPGPGSGAGDLQRARDGGRPGIRPGRLARDPGRLARPHGEWARGALHVVSEHLPRRDGAPGGRLRERCLPGLPGDERGRGVPISPRPLGGPGSTGRCIRSRRPCRRACARRGSSTASGRRAVPGSRSCGRWPSWASVPTARSR